MCGARAEYYPNTKFALDFDHIKVSTIVLIMQLCGVEVYAIHMKIISTQFQDVHFAVTTCDGNMDGVLTFTRQQQQQLYNTNSVKEVLQGMSTLTSFYSRIFPSPPRPALPPCTCLGRAM